MISYAILCYHCDTPITQCDATASMTNQTARLAIYFERGVVAVGHLYGVVRKSAKKAVVVGGSFFGSRSQLYVIPPSPPLDQLPQMAYISHAHQ